MEHRIKNVPFDLIYYVIENRYLDCCGILHHIRIMGCRFLKEIGWPFFLAPFIIIHRREGSGSENS